jgi:hypothetical protein
MATVEKVNPAGRSKIAERVLLVTTAATSTLQNCTYRGGDDRCDICWHGNIGRGRTDVGSAAN